MDRGFISREQNIIQNNRKHTGRRVYVALIWAALILVASSMDFSLDQDIVSYQDNILQMDGRENNLGISDVRSKLVFYSVIVMPLYKVFGSIDMALLMIKLAIVTIFFVIFYLKATDLRELMMFSALLLIVPTFVEHYQEYLRQGLAFAFLFWGMLLKRLAPKFFLIFFSLALHLSAILALLGFIVYRFVNGRLDQVSNAFVVIFMMVCSISLGLLIYINPWLGYDIAVIDFLSGQRSNIFGYIFVFLYMVVLAYQLLRSPQPQMFVAFFLACTFCSLYPNITDFGRYLSIISICHFIAISGNPKKTMYFDIAGASFLSIVPLLL